MRMSSHVTGQNRGSGRAVDTQGNIADSPAAWIVTVRASRHQTVRSVEIIVTGDWRSHDHSHHFVSVEATVGLVLPRSLSTAIDSPSPLWLAIGLHYSGGPLA